MDRERIGGGERGLDRGVRRRTGRGVMVVGVVSLLALPLAAAVHQQLLRSEPAQGEEMSISPERLRLVFAEPIELAVTQIQLASAGATTVPLSRLSLDPDSANILVAEVERTLAPGSYVIRWRTAGIDGHPVNDSIPFVVAIGPGASHLDHHDP